jgi:hypothetical protein
LSIAPNTANMIKSPTAKSRWKVTRHSRFLSPQSSCNGCDILQLITVKYGSFHAKVSKNHIAVIFFAGNPSFSFCIQME